MLKNTTTVGRRGLVRRVRSFGRATNANYPAGIGICGSSGRGGLAGVGGGGGGSGMGSHSGAGRYKFSEETAAVRTYV